MMKLLLVVAISVVLLFSVTDFSGERPKHGESLLTVHFPDFRLIPTTGASGPESFVFDFSGDGPYTGLSDGRIVKWLANDSRWIDFAVTTSTRQEEKCLYLDIKTNRALNGEISRDALLAKVSQERELRSYARRASAAALYIQNLYELGARRIGVISLPPMGCLTAAITLFGAGNKSCVERLNSDAVMF